jgi:glyoxylate reductase
MPAFSNPGFAHMASQSARRVFATADIGGDALDRLRQMGCEVEVYPEVEAPPKSVVLKRVSAGIDALITTLRDVIDEEVFAAGAGTLRVVAQDAVGFNNIDRAAANRYRIPFTNTADVLTEATAEFAFFMIGGVARKLYPSRRLVEENRWGTWHPYEPFLGDEVTGKTVTVIGIGRIGKALIKKCIGFDMDVLCYDATFPGGRGNEAYTEAVTSVMKTRRDAGLCERRQRIEHVSFDEALQRADFVSLHVPLLMPGESAAPTYHLMSTPQFKLMKPTAYLINTSRGPIVDEQALFQALMNNEIAGAALDVFETEPLPHDSVLRDERLYLRLDKYHHFASGARATRLSSDPNVGMAGRCVQGVIDVLEGRYGGDPGRMPYVVNKEGFQ